MSRTVRMFTTYAADNGDTATPGQSIELADETAEDLVGKGYAEYADDDGRDKRRGRRRGRQAKEPAEPKPVDKMTVEELTAYAADNGIDLGGATSKRDILAAIEAAQDPDE